ncbi:hypothetical protein BT96DRAFT_828537, partial [Gymnopus androsaceus JB14]
EEPNAPPAKRAKQDSSRFNWASDAFIKRSVLSAKHTKVIEAVENYKLDLDTALDSVEQSGLNPWFPKKLWKAVLKDEYVELSEVLAMATTQHKPDTSRSVSNAFAEALESTNLIKPTPSKAIVDQVTWRRAWQGTADAINFAFADRGKELNRYEQHIQRQFDDNRPSFHQNVIQYDRAVRLLIGSRRDLLFDDFEHADIARFRTVYLLPTGIHFSLSDSSPAQPGTRSRNQVKERAKEVCRKFNRGECSGCDRIHSCWTCGESGHGGETCKKGRK